MLRAKPFDGVPKMAGKIIRQGDKTSGPQCKDTHPIVEAAPVATLYGKGVARAGMKWPCGAVLAAGQFTDTVE